MLLLVVRVRARRVSLEFLYFIASVYFRGVARGCCLLLLLPWNPTSNSDWDRDRDGTGVAWRQPVGVTKICHCCPGLQRHPMAQRLWLGRWLGFGTGPARTWAAGALASLETVDILGRSRDLMSP